MKGTEGRVMDVRGMGRKKAELLLGSVLTVSGCRAPEVIFLCRGLTLTTWFANNPIIQNFG